VTRRSSQRPADSPAAPQPGGNTLRRVLWAALTVAVLASALAAWRLSMPPEPAPAAHASAAAPPQAADYVGSAACATCHQQQATSWQQSQHARAMQQATAENVLGDFNAARHVRDGVTSTFFRRDGRFIARTDGPDGALADFEIRYTFGLEPLQQYLVELPGGRLQALSVSWDARPKAQGGQRWFRQYPDERLDHRDELHWTRRSQNWNFMCADCHSTRIRKGYDAAAGSFQTTWSEISVGCESCHGPASAHLAWARAPRKDDDRKGLTVALRERNGVGWTIDASTGNARRSRPRDTAHEIDTCAQCHARRSQFSEDYRPGEPFLDHYLPALLSAGLYHADGQQRDEVFTWGSFLQSRMHGAGVTCSDCHDPHTQKLRAEGDAVCAQCHQPAKYAAPTHHFHDPASEAARCVSCHMPATTYMVVDPRRDHGFRVPRPDLVQSTGSPNACIGCHADRSPKWAADSIAKVHGPSRRQERHFGEALHAGRTGGEGAAAALRALAEDANAAPIVRASAVELLARYPGQPTDAVLRRALIAPEPLLRLAAVQSAASQPPQAMAELLGSLLSDPRRAVRLEATRALVSAGVPLDARAPRAMQRALAEFETVQRGNLERPESWMTLANLHLQRGAAAEAEQALRAALRVDPLFAPIYVNLSDLYRATGREADAEAVLREGLKQLPSASALHEALGLALVRQGRKREALPVLAAAVKADPQQARHAYVYALALDDAGRRRESIDVLSAAATRTGQRDVLLALAQMRRASGDMTGAAQALRRLAAINPDDPALAAPAGSR
jgi:tetratricopeptide (TPR) repeat protein